LGRPPGATTFLADNMVHCRTIMKPHAPFLSTLHRRHDTTSTGLRNATDCTQDHPAAAATEDNSATLSSHGASNHPTCMMHSSPEHIPYRNSHSQGSSYKPRLVPRPTTCFQQQSMHSAPASEEAVIRKKEGLQVADVLLGQAQVGPRKGALALLHLLLGRRWLRLGRLGLGHAGTASLHCS
jgi:hypothetical protein